MTERTLQFRLGLFVLVVLILLAGLIVLFGGWPTFFQATDTYTITFDNAPGVQKGTPVRRFGVKIGEVERVRLDDEADQVIVTIRVRSEYRLRQTDTAALRQGLLGDDALIEFIPPETDKKKPADRKILKPGAKIQGTTQIGAAEVVQKAGKVMPPTEEAMKQMTKVLKKMDKLFPLMEDTMKEFREAAEATNEIMPALKDTTKEIEKLAKSANDTIPDLKRTNDEIQLTARNWGKLGERLDVAFQTNEKKIVESLENLNKTLEEMNKVFSKENRQNLEEILRNVSEGSKKFDSIVRNTEALIKDSRKTVNRVTDSIEKADRVLGDLEKVTKPMAERSEKILQNMDSATAELNKAMSEFRVLMKDVGQSQGTVYKMLTDPALYNRLNDAAYRAAKVFPRLDRILRDVEIFTDKIARHPELLGVGGAVRPSSGLKDMPPYPIIWKGVP